MEKSPFISCSAAVTIFFTGRSIINLRLMPSITVQSRLNKITFKKVILAACSMRVCVNSSPVVLVTILRNRIMQQLITKAINRKKARYRRKENIHRSGPGGGSAVPKFIHQLRTGKGLFGIGIS